MGIPRLNRLLRSQGSASSIRLISLNALRGSRLVIDSSIYLYKYLAEGCFVENLYTLSTRLRQFGIAALFVFDGKPPHEKQEEISRRFDRKTQCKAQYQELIKRYNEMGPCPAKHKMKYELEKLKRQFVRLSPEDLQLAKDLVLACGLQIYDAVGEADAVCARLVRAGVVDACLSEDTDLFPLGCPVVLRHLSLSDSTVLRYDLSGILKDLNMSFEEFRDVCVASGCDYNDSSNRSIPETIRWFEVFRKSGHSSSFLDWLTAATKYVSDPEATSRSLELFQLCDASVPDLKVALGKVSPRDLRSILGMNGFLFAD